MDIYEKLNQLKSLLDHGLLSQEEFNNLKKELLFTDNISPEIESNKTTNFESSIKNPVLTTPKINSYNETDNSNITETKITLIIAGLIIIFFVFLLTMNNNENDETHLTRQADSTSASIDSIQKISIQEDTNNCTICGRNFTGNGFSEIADGVWQLSDNSHQSYICSQNCGRKHTEEINRILNRSNTNSNSGSSGYQQGNDGRVYEKNACPLCSGTGLETGREYDGSKVSRVCPMCDGRGVRSY